MNLGWFSLWNVFEDVACFRIVYLIVDVAIGLMITFSAALLFELWRRQRERILQFYVRDIFLFACMVSIACSIFAFHRSQYVAEKNVLQLIEKIKDPGVQWSGTVSDRVGWQPAGPSWIRQLVGNHQLQMLDRVVGIDTSGDELKLVVKLQHIKYVCISNVSNQQLRLLEDLPQLEALDMCYANLDDSGQELIDEDGYVIEQSFHLPRLPKLRGLNLYNTAFRGDGLENIPSIEVLELAGTDIDDDSIPALSSLTKLKTLSLCGTAISDSGIEHLREVLPDCEILR